MIICELYDECHGIIGHYANIDKAKLECYENAKNYDIDNSTPLDYDGEIYWGWEESYIKMVEVIE